MECNWAHVNTNQNFLADGEYNAKYVLLTSMLSKSKGKHLSEAMDYSNLEFLSNEHPTYRPTDIGKISDLLNFCIPKNIPRRYFEAKNCYDLSSDHS